MNPLSQKILNIYFVTPWEWSKDKYAKQFRDWFEATFVEGKVCQDEVTKENWTLDLWEAIDSVVEWDKIQEKVSSARQKQTLCDREIPSRQETGHWLHGDMYYVQREAWRDEAHDRAKQDAGF